MLQGYGREYERQTSPNDAIYRLKWKFVAVESLMRHQLVLLTEQRYYRSIPSLDMKRFLYSLPDEQFRQGYLGPENGFFGQTLCLITFLLRSFCL